MQQGKQAQFFYSQLYQLKFISMANDHSRGYNSSHDSRRDFNRDNHNRTEYSNYGGASHNNPFNQRNNRDDREFSQYGNNGRSKDVYNANEDWRTGGDYYSRRHQNDRNEGFNLQRGNAGDRRNSNHYDLPGRENDNYDETQDWRHEGLAYSRYGNVSGGYGNVDADYVETGFNSSRNDRDNYSYNSQSASGNRNQHQRKSDNNRRDANQESHRGKGPKGYQRSDERIHEDVCDRLGDDHHLDASDIEVTVTASEVTLSGHVDTREDKRRAEDLAEHVSGVKHIQNQIRVGRENRPSANNDRSTTAGGKQSAGNE